MLLLSRLPRCAGVSSGLDSLKLRIPTTTHPPTGVVGFQFLGAVGAPADQSIEEKKS